MAAARTARIQGLDATGCAAPERVPDDHLDAALDAALVATASDLILLTDRDGRIRRANEAARRLYGFDPAAMVGTRVHDYLHPDELVAVSSTFELMLDVDEVHGLPIEVRIRAADNSWRCVEVVTTNLLRDPVVGGIVFTCRDLSFRYNGERRFRQMFEQSPVAQALIGPGRVGVIANLAFASLFDTTPEALRLVEAKSLVHPDDRPEAAEARAILATGEAERVFGERRYLRAGGEVFTGRTASSALRSLDGSFEYLFTTVEDVTMQLRASEAIARSEARARALVENSPDIIALLYPDGEWEASDQGTRLLGYPKGFDPEGGVFSLIHPDDVERASTALGEILAGTRTPSTPIDIRLRAADDTYRQFECVGSNLTDDVHIGGVVITARDITERKVAEARLHAAEERFQIAFEHAPLSVSIIDLNGTIVDINAAGCEMLGYERAHLLGTPAENTVHPDDRALAIELTAAQLDGSPIPVEFRVVCSDGRIRHTLSHASLVAPTDPDEPPYVITLQTDITDRKLLERELEQRASQDILTGLGNRASLSRHLEYALSRRNGPPLAAIFIDLDNFKAVNDTLGHEAGDVVLVEVAQRISATVRGSDIAARLGGDEFVVVCDVDHSPVYMREVAERIRTAIAGVSEPGSAVNVTASIGVAISEPTDDAASLLRRADAGAYLAKRAGKNRVEIVAGASVDALDPHERVRAMRPEAIHVD